MSASRFFSLRILLFNSLSDFAMVADDYLFCLIKSEICDFDRRVSGVFGYSAL